MISQPTSTDSNGSPLHKFLANGMEVHLQESHFAPLINLQVWVKTGSIDESDEEAGMAHVLEHMLFKGTESFPKPGGIAGMVEAAGGDMNAYTTFDHTVYYLTAPTEFAKQGAHILIDMVSKSLIDDQELARELEVIREEIRRGRDNPTRVVSQNLFSRIYSGTRLARPVIGFEEIVEKFTPERVRAFYRKWYSPNNMLFIGSGDFQSLEMFSHLNQVSQSFRPLSVPPRERPPLNVHGAFSHGRAAVSLVRGPYQEVRFQLGVPAPGLHDVDFSAWEMFASILGHGDSSRLARTVRDDLQLVLGIDCDVYAPTYPGGMLSLSFYGKGSTADEALVTSLEQMQTLAEEGPQTEEMTRVLNAVKAERIYARESVEGLSRTAGLSLFTTGRLDFEDVYLENLSKVTLDEVQQVARKVLNHLHEGTFAVSCALARDVCEEWSEEHLRSLIKNTVDPSEKNEGHSQSLWSTQTEGIAHPQTQMRQEVVSPSHPDVRQWVFSLPHHRKMHFNWRVQTRLPVVSFCLTFRGGQQLESPTQAGLGTFVSQMLTRGTKKQSYTAFVTELEDRAASVSAFCSRDLFGIRLDCLEEHLPRVFSMLCDALFRPAFDAGEFEKVVSETKDILVAQKDSPGSRLARLSGPLLYGEHPYAHPAYGTETLLNSITLEEVQTHWLKLLTSCETFVVSCAGKFDTETLSQKMWEELRNFCTHHPHMTLPALQNPQIPESPQAKEARTAHDVLEREQAHISLNFRALTLKDPRRTALELASTILAGQGGRLFLDLRDQKSLAYSVGASQSPGLLAGVFSTYIGTAANKAQQAMEGLKFHIEKMAKEPVAEEELSRAKASLLGSQAVDAQHVHTQATQLAMSDVYGLGFDNFLRFSERVKKVTTSDIQAVMRDLLEKNPPVLCCVGPEGTWSPEQGDPLLTWNLD
jgi:zinc protease